jgi:hypothetical protein
MIPVQLKAEPVSFNNAVRQPGKAYLVKNPMPTSKEFQKNSHWKKSAQDLHAAYSGICAYTCFYLAPYGSTDHFLPKSNHPNEAYEWNNFRLCSPRVNGYKGDSADVIDPFVVQPGWFALDVPSCLVKPGVGLSDVVTTQVEATIKRLRLNDDDYFVQERCDLMVAFASCEVTMAFLSKRYLFLATEIERQGLQATAAQIFKGLHTG